MVVADFSIYHHDFDKLQDLFFQKIRRKDCDS